ncbi:uncharacterized protein FMAN_15283 [Fusarium mangiferae]|uniref:Uncharacterized protein n=1 Tax=Fusarium mangiferae TaxID=192010 RepID=A0A1L7UHD4_FUSMA|nr:uncharacterized protein FMAN_15283 [Fusarium mangiferae]CVL07137.1 uncharacterized protein FMAN_15283 [Fusarium mangiferae]
MFQLLLTVYPWLLVPPAVYFTIFVAIRIVNRVPCRPYLLLIPSASHLVLHYLHLYMYDILDPYEPLPWPLVRVTGVTSFVIISYTLIICFGRQCRQPQAAESERVHSAAPVMNIQDGQEDKDKTRERSDVTRKSDIPLYNPNYRYLKMLPSHNSSAGHAICEVCKLCEKFGAHYEDSFKTCHLGMDCAKRKSPTRTQQDSPVRPRHKAPTHIQDNSPTRTQRTSPATFDRLFNYRMAVVVWCILIVSMYLLIDIHFLTAQSQHTLFHVRENGIVELAVIAMRLVSLFWLISIAAFYLIRWFVIYPTQWFGLPVLYFCMARADPRISLLEVCDNAVEIAHCVEEGSGWSKTSIVVGWLRESVVRAQQLEQRKKGRV